VAYERRLRSDQRRADGGRRARRGSGLRAAAAAPASGATQAVLTWRDAGTFG
jgi:hypothetical protein